MTTTLAATRGDDPNMSLHAGFTAVGVDVYYDTETNPLHRESTPQRQ